MKRSKNNPGAPIQCNECGHVFRRKIGPKTFEIRCPQCGGYDTEIGSMVTVICKRCGQEFSAPTRQEAYEKGREHLRVVHGKMVNPPNKITGKFEVLESGSTLVGAMRWETPELELKHLDTGHIYYWVSETIEHKLDYVERGEILHLTAFYRPRKQIRSDMPVLYHLYRVTVHKRERKPSRKQNPENCLYESFHGVSPVRKTPVYYQAPPKEIINIGELSQINYKPVRGQHKGTEFYHKAGDLGEKTIKTNMILATDKEGKNLYLVKKNKNNHYPTFTDRGIIG